MSHKILRMASGNKVMMLRRTTGSPKKEHLLKKHQDSNIKLKIFFLICFVNDSKLFNIN